MVNTLHVPYRYKQKADVVTEKMQLIISSIRSHLKMDIAFISNFSGGNRIIQYVDGDSKYAKGLLGSSAPVDESYCHLIAEGTLPPIIADSALHPAAKKLSVTERAGIASYIAAPLSSSDGDIYGMFCCIGHEVNQGLGERDLAVMSVFADMAGAQISDQINEGLAYLEVRDRIEAVMTPEKLNITYQPIYDLKQQKISGYEALARFDTDPYRSPDIWFAEALSVDLGQELELLAVKRGLEGMLHINNGAYISLNVSPEIILSGVLYDVFDDEISHRIILEVTEHSKVLDYAEFRDAINVLRKKGVRFAVDDVGAGFASFQHILELGAEVIKLDISLIKGIDNDPARSALASALIAFSKKTNTKVIAEGVETREEYEELLRIGVDKIQGYYIGYPMPVEQVIFYTPIIDEYRT